MGLDKLIEFLFGVLDDLLPWFITDEYQETVVLRAGRIRRKFLWIFNYNPIKGKGFHLKFPFIDKPQTYTVVSTTEKTEPQTILTKDMVSVTVKAIIKYDIDDVEAVLTAIYDSINALQDITQGHIANEINKLTYQECSNTAELSNTITKKVRNDAKKYGINVLQITLTNFVQTRNYRLYNEVAQSND